MVPPKFFFNGFRFVILALGVCCLASISGNYNVMNFTFICMTGDENDVIETSNGTLRQRYDYTPTEKGAIIWAVAIGTIVGTFPINYAYVRFGAKIPFFLAGLTSAASTALIPIGAHLGLPFLVFLRFIQGLAYAADFAAIGILCVRWAPLSQIAIFIGFLTSFSTIAHSIVNPVAGMFCTSPAFGWRWAFYAQAIFTVFIFALWLLCYSDDPQKHSSVSEKELELIQRGKTKAHIERDSFVPYRKIITNSTILIIWANALTELVTMIILFTYAPIYINKVLGYSVKETSVLASLGSILHFPIKLISAFLSDTITCVSEVKKMIFFNTIAVGISGITCGLIGVMPSAALAVAFISIAGGITAFNCGGFYKCGTHTSRQYAHFVLATIQFSKCLALFIGPGMVALFTKSDEDAAGWNTIFFINAGLMIVSNVLFYFVATDKPAPFTFITRQSAKNDLPLSEKQEITDDSD